MRILKYFINLLLIFIIIIFFIENSQLLSQRVQLHFGLFMPGLLWKIPELPLYFLFLVFFALGGIITGIIFLWGRIGVSRRLSRANKKIRGLEKEVNAYRQRPLLSGDEQQAQEEFNNKPASGTQGV